jgi:glycosyltransferase involved in cell wall biosynthesis
MNRPRLTIGVPVYNGEDFLREALDSLVAQSFGDFELLISDNASTDSTRDICAEYRDSRIRYHRNETNVGAARNYNALVHMARGELFKWAAHDDVCAPDFLKRSVEALDANPAAVVGYTQARIIDEHGRDVDYANGYEPGVTLASPHVHERFRELICRRHRCFPVFGVIRTEALRKTPLLEVFSHADRLLLGRLLFLGPFAQVPEALFLSRVHATASGQLFSTPDALLRWWDPKLKGRLLMPHWRVFFEYFRVAGSSPARRADRLRCYAEILRSIGIPWWRRKLADDLKRPLGAAVAGIRQ